MFKAIHQLRAKISRGERGFTLVELLIVVAIIGILAAIAIPQFAAYRTRSYNAAATSDLRNVRTTQESFFADNSSYAPTPLATGALPFTYEAAVIGTFNVSKNVVLGVETDNDPANSGAVATSYTITDKNTAGDRIFCGEAEQSAVLWAASAVGTAAAPADQPGATNANDCTATFPNQL